MEQVSNLTLVIRNSAFHLLAEGLSREVFTKLPTYAGAKDDLLVFVWKDKAISQQVFDAWNPNVINGNDYYISFLRKDIWLENVEKIDEYGNYDLNIINVKAHTTIIYDALPPHKR